MRFQALPDKPLLDLAILAVLLALLFSWGLGDRPYSAPSEARYIEIGREMAESGDFVTPRLDYVKYFEKPPLFYWIQAEWTREFGVSPFISRVPNALFTIAICLLTCLLARMLYGRLAGVLGALVMATCLYTFALSRVVLLDVPVSFFMAATLSAFLYAAEKPDGRKRTFIIYMMYLMAAGAVLTKGLIGMVLPGAVIFLWLLLTGRWDLLKRMHVISGTILFLIVAAPWHILVAMRNPEWTWFYFVHEHFLRYLTPEAKRGKPVWFFLVVTLAGWFPWIMFFAQAKFATLPGFWKHRHENGRPLFLMLWIGFIFVFFSLSHSQLIGYIMPIFPPMAAMLGCYLAEAWRQKPVRGFGAGCAALVLSLLLMAIVPSMLLNVMDAGSKVAITLKEGGDDLAYLSYGCMIAAAALLVVFIQGQRRHAIAAMLLTAVMVVELGDGVAAHYNKDSMASFAGVIQHSNHPTDEVAMYQVYYQDMPVYLERRVTLVDFRGELEYGSAHEDDSAWIEEPDAFWQRWMKGDTGMFLIMRDDAFDRLTKDKTMESLHFYPVRRDGRNLLLMNSNPMAAPAGPKAKGKTS